MTLEEKVSLMSGKDFWQTASIDRLEIKSIFLADGPHGVRRQAVDSDQIGLRDGIPATCFPTAATFANSWNEMLVQELGAYLGKEAIAQGVNVLLGPGVNIKRNPLCGRNFEYLSEDPYLAGKMAAAYIRGVQSQGVASCVKHFAAANQEERSMSINAIIDERTLREIYLTAFEIAVKEGKTQTLMTAYHKINGTYANEHPLLMQDILRNEWGYSGCVISNWGGSNSRVAGLLAGNELEMPSSGGDTNQDIINAIISGELDIEVLEQSVDRLLDLIFATTELENEPQLDFNIGKHHRFTQRVAEESTVLLKNEDAILPIKFGTKVAFIGEFAEHSRYQGAGSSIVTPTILDHTLKCLDESGITSIGYEQGFTRYGRPSSTLVRKACNLAKQADVVLLYLGLDEWSEAQGIDRSTMKLPKNQVHLLESLSEVSHQIVVVLSCGTVIEMPWINKVKGLVHGYLGGQAGARAILRILSGDVNPSAKLAESYPLSYGDVPSADHFPGSEATVEYREGVFVGYRYYETVKVPVLFPFGFGLSYTDYTYSDLKIEEKGVSFTIENIGAVAGMEIAQLYISYPDSKIWRPLRELKGFSKVFINPSDSKRVYIPFDDKSFRYFDVNTKNWEVEEGEYQILIGASSQDIRLTGNRYIKGTKKLTHSYSEKYPSYYSGKIFDVTDQEFEKLLGEPLPSSQWDRKVPLGYNDTIAQCKYAKSRFARFSYALLVCYHWFLRKIGQRRRANVITMSIYQLPFRGISRMTRGAVSMSQVDGLLLIVNGHFFKGIRQLFRRKKSTSTSP